MHDHSDTEAMKVYLMLNLFCGSALATASYHHAELNWYAWYYSSYALVGPQSRQGGWILHMSLNFASNQKKKKIWASSLAYLFVPHSELSVLSYFSLSCSLSFPCGRESPRGYSVSSSVLVVESTWGRQEDFCVCLFSSNGTCLLGTCGCLLAFLLPPTGDNQHL